MPTSMHMFLCCPIPSGNREQQWASEHGGVVQDDPQPLLRTNSVTLICCKVLSAAQLAYNLPTLGLRQRACCRSTGKLIAASALQR
jgi:hypothetical protein